MDDFQYFAMSDPSSFTTAMDGYQYPGVDNSAAFFNGPGDYQYLGVNDPASVPTGVDPYQSAGVDNARSFVAGVDQDIKTATDALKFVEEWSKLAPGQGAALQMPQGQAPMPQLGAIPAQMSVPGAGAQMNPAMSQTNVGVDLTGMWAPPNNPMDQTYIRQVGQYLTTATSANGIPIALGQGLFLPQQSALQVAGQYANGARFQLQAQLLRNWVIQGMLTTLNAVGNPYQIPILLAKMA